MEWLLILIGMQSDTGCPILLHQMMTKNGTKENEMAFAVMVSITDSEVVGDPTHWLPLPPDP